MRSRHLAIVAVALAAVAAAAATASATPLRGFEIPACEAILTRAEAAAATGEPKALIGDRSIEFGTRLCVYAGGQRGGRVGHQLLVWWGPYDDYFRLSQVVAGHKAICGLSKPACKLLDAARETRSDRASFGQLAKAYDKAGTVRRLWSGFDGNPAYIWDLTPEIYEVTAVYVYDARSRSLLVARCNAFSGVSSDYDHPCAVAAAKRAYNNVTS